MHKTSFKIIQRLYNFLSEEKRQERGDTLPATMVSAIVGAILLIICGSLILTTLNSQNTLTANNTVLATGAALETSFRADVSNASLIAPVNATDMVLTVPGRNGKCKTAEWKITNGSVNRIITNYTDQSLSAAGLVSCAGTVGTPITVNMAGNVGTSAAFTYANRAGRPLTATTTSGTTTVAYTNSSAAAPSGTPTTEWNSLVVAQVSTNLTVTNGSGTTTNTTQAITQMSGAANPLPPNTGTATSAQGTAAGSGTTYTSPTTLAAPTGSPTSNVLASSAFKLTWSAASCPSGSTASYSVNIVDDTNNDANVNVPATISGTTATITSVPNYVSNVGTASTATATQYYNIGVKCVVSNGGQAMESFTSANSSTIGLTLPSPSTMAAPTYTASTKVLKWTAPSTGCPTGTRIYYAPQFAASTSYSNIISTGTSPQTVWTTATSVTVSSAAPSGWTSSGKYYYRVYAACMNTETITHKSANSGTTATSAAA